MCFNCRDAQFQPVNSPINKTEPGSICLILWPEGLLDVLHVILMDNSSDNYSSRLSTFSVKAVSFSLLMCLPYLRWKVWTMKGHIFTYYRRRKCQNNHKSHYVPVIIRMRKLCVSGDCDHAWFQLKGKNIPELLDVRSLFSLLLQPSLMVPGRVKDMKKLTRRTTSSWPPEGDVAQIKIRIEDPLPPQPSFL